MLAYKKFTKDVVLVTIVNILVVIKGIIFLPLITKMLGAFSYGVWAQLLITVGLISPVVRLGLTNAIVRFVPAEKNTEEIKEGVYSAIFLISALSLIVFLGFLAFAEPMASFFQAPKILVLILPLIILFECLNMLLLSTFQAILAMKRYSVFMIMLSSAEIILVVAAVYLGYGLIGAVFSLLVAKIIAFILIYSNIYRTIGITWPTFHLIKKYVSFGIPTLLSNVSYLAVTSIDKYLIAFFMGTLFVGYYAPAYSLGNVITFLIIPISFVLFPAVAKSYDEGKLQEVRTKLRYSLKYFLLVAIPSVFGISVLIKQILNLFTTQDIAAHAFFITPLVAASILFYGASDIFSLILTLVKKTRLVGYVWIAAALANIALNLLLIPKTGILGVALATLAAYALAFFLLWYYAFKELTFSIDWSAIIKILCCSAIMSLVVWKIHPQNTFTIIIAIIAGMACYGALIILTKTFTKRELEFLKNLRKSSTPPAASS